ncbi:LysM peptidoglycan-binding domain-containing protein [Halomonas salipaludis]|uniref:Peptidoglycan-binding protein n=1 Tax=Halomonas salipaludis TaxID=2032625 RepID=A0A2A2ERR1_9GAMM|nr:LysM domain-containing protein [Halomonas salipaludis]PAU75095.1 peptidoglycan-binding protein [Halomonas salipaludis]
MSASGARRGAWHGWGAGWALLLSLPAMGQGLSDAGLRGDAPDRYTVVRGDTLWDISGHFLRHPWQWPEVWGGNPQIRNPHVIYPGDTVYLYYQDGRPRLGLERGRGGEVRLSPEVRRTPRREAVPPLPLERVENFLAEYRVLDDPAQADEQAYVVGGGDRRLISGAGDRIYVRGDLADHGRLGIYRLGETYEDSVTGEFLGLELVGVGQARWLRSEGDIATLDVLSANQEVRNGDLMLPLESGELVTEFMPRAPQRAVDGRLLAVPGGVQFIGRQQVVALDRGRRDGLTPGHVLSVEQRGELVTDPVTNEALRLPGEEAGLVMVFKSYERMSYALVMRASRSLVVGDRIFSPDSNATLAQR